MAIIKPSKNFIGSEIDLRDAGKYIKPDVRQVVFNKRVNQTGAYLFFLPPYKVDAQGNGVWYKTFTIRDNFGDKFKEKYVCADKADPVAHFERNLKILYPDLAAIKESTDEKGQSRKVYPFCGRVTKRVVYNVAYLDKLQLGAHVLDLPLFNGASILDAWQKEKDTRGRERPLICDPENCIPVFIKLRDGGGAPWQIEPSLAEASVIPEALADADNLYNLDEIFVKKTAQELIAKLAEMYSNDVFTSCMEGYPGYMSNTTINTPIVPTATPAPRKLDNIQVASVSKAVSAAASTSAPADAVSKEYVDDMDVIPGLDPSPPKVSAEEAAAFLRRPRPRVTGA